MELSLEQIVNELSRRKLEGGWVERFFTGARSDYPKHHEFFEAGKKYRTRLFVAGNQVGKSTSAAVEIACHMTGIYPSWWDGIRFERPVSGWIVGKNTALVTQTIQPNLLGPVNAFGTGLIAKECLDLATLTDVKRASSPISTFRVKHISGGYSTCAFKSGEQGRESFQAATLDFVWCDEEVPYDVFNECAVRLMVRKGIMLYSFSPLKGTSEVIKAFSVDGNFVEGAVGNDAYIVRCSMYDAKHIDAGTIEDIKNRTPPFLRDARILGIPSLGAGAIYPVPESEFVVPSFPIPKHWKRMFGMDVGAKTAAVWLAQNPDNNQWHAYQEYYRERAEPAIHAAAIASRGSWIPGAIDPASRQRSQIDGQQLMEMYKERGLSLSKAINAVESGLYTVWDMLSTDQLKIHDNCTFLLREMRGYSRNEKGEVIKKEDHLCDSLRYAVMTRDIASTELAQNSTLNSVVISPIRM